MIWENSSHRFKSIFIAILFSFLTAGLCAISIMFVCDVPIKTEVKIKVSEMGREIIRNHRTKVDSLIEQKKVPHIHDAFVHGQISQEDKLLRLRIVQKQESIQKLSNILCENKSTPNIH